MLYDPRIGMCYQVETPCAFTKGPDCRAGLTHHAAHDVATTRGPPLVAEEADELARVSAGERVALRCKLPNKLDSDWVKSYDNIRWVGADE